MNDNSKIMYIFLRDKIIGIDTILPLCMEIHDRCGYKFNFISFDRLTYKYIIEDNIVIRDAINSIGKIELVSSGKYKSLYVSKIFSLFYFLKVAFNVAVKNYYIIHSAHLHLKPFMWFRWLFKKNNVIFIEKKPFGIGNQIDFKNVKNHNLAYKNRMTYKDISEFGIDIYSHPPLLYAGTLIGYDKDWNYFKHPAANKLKKIVIDGMGIRKNGYWIDFLNKNVNRYIENEMPKGVFKSDNILVFLATRITRATDTNAINEFVGALRALSKYMHIFPLFIKLHTFSDLEFINELLGVAIEEKNSTRYVITKLHPAVLSNRSVISVFANQGTLMKEFSGLGVPVVDLQIYENILSNSYFDLSTDLSKNDLKKRYKSRKELADYTFSDAESFDNFMKKKSFELDNIRPEPKKRVTYLESCDF
jgi:hypothetical protein